MRRTRRITKAEHEAAIQNLLRIASQAEQLLLTHTGVYQTEHEDIAIELNNAIRVVRGRVTDIERVSA